MENSRRLQRYSLKLPATLEINSEAEQHDQEVINLLTSDVCSGGAYFQTDQPLPEGTKVKLDLILSIEELKKLEGKHALIKVTGKVIRTESTGMAICFEGGYAIKPVN
jgi:hypothetical protein